MGELCRTEEGENWESEIKGAKEGAFDIKTEDQFGFFTGTFSFGGIDHQIVGRCDGSFMYFLRPADKPRYFYVGRFSDGEHVHGYRASLPAADSVGTRDEETWDGTKTTLLERRLA